MIGLRSGAHVYAPTRDSGFRLSDRKPGAETQRGTRPSTPFEFYASIRNELAPIKQAGLFKRERIITSPQGGMIDIADSQHVINLCANNYLGLSSHPTVADRARAQLRPGVRRRPAGPETLAREIPTIRFR